MAWRLEVYILESQWELSFPMKVGLNKKNYTEVRNYL